MVLFERVQIENGRKQQFHLKYCNMLIDDEPLLKGSIDDLNNANKYEEAAEKEDDDDEDDNINIDPNINIDASNDDE
jgi:hypothetical protein